MPVDYRIIVARRDFRKLIGQGYPAAVLANILDKPPNARGSAKALFTDCVCSCFGIRAFALYGGRMYFERNWLTDSNNLVCFVPKAEIECI